MNKQPRDNIEKSFLAISTIAILLMITITISPAMNASAVDLDLISKDCDVGSIDNDILYNLTPEQLSCLSDPGHSTTERYCAEFGVLTQKDVFESGDPFAAFCYGLRWEEPEEFVIFIPQIDDYLEDFE